MGGTSGYASGYSIVRSRSARNIQYEIIARGANAAHVGFLLHRAGLPLKRLRFDTRCLRVLVRVR